jgi:NAD+ synthase (glutamine-hydrolysing)
MRVRAEQLNPIIGDFEGNTRLILDAISRARSAETDLLILPEMVVTGYPVQDLLENEAFREMCYRTNQEIISASEGIAVLFGSITPNNGFGRKMYNTAILARNGETAGEVHKTLLPTYDIFDDLRYFEPNREFKCLEMDGIKLGVTICEDIWYNENEVQYHTYDTDPAKEQKKAGADVIINISASPYTKKKHENRVQMLQNHVKRLGLPLFYSNQTGTHTDVIFDGDTMMIDSNGVVVAATVPFGPGFADVEWNPVTRHVASVQENQPVYPKSNEERQFRAMICGIKDYFHKTGFAEGVVLGLSGGIDSALVCVLAAEALGPDKVTAITLPGRYSSSGSVDDSKKLAENLGVRFEEISIETINGSFLDSLKPLFGDRPQGTAEENLQSRIRGTLLMAFSNKFNRFLLATGNKSEYAVGYATLYGDMNGALAPIGDLYKTEVYSICEWLNSRYYKKEVIPAAILEKEPSAELRPDQKDSDSLPEYDILDDILYRYIDLQQSREEIIAGGHDQKAVTEMTRLVDLNEFKRFQAAPILKLSSKSFGMGRRRPIVQKWTQQKIGRF